MSRTNLVLLILLALQGGIVLLQLVGGRGDEAVQAGPFLDGLSVAAVQEMTLSDGDSAVTLRRTATGWGVVENDLYPASADKTGELLQELVAISTREMISRSSAHHVDLEVAEAAFNRRVRVEAGEQTHTIYVGKAGPGGSTYVRREGEDDVFSVSDFSE